MIDRLVASEEFEAVPGTIEHEITRWVLAERARHSWIDVGEHFDFPVSGAKVERILGLAPLPREASREVRAERRFVIVRHKFVTAVRELATDLAIESWDDDGLGRALDRMEREEAARNAGRRQ